MTTHMSLFFSLQSVCNVGMLCAQPVLRVSDLICKGIGNHMDRMQLAS